VGAVAAVLIEVIDLNDVRVSQAGQNLGLLEEFVDGFLQDFDGGLRFEEAIFAQIDLGKGSTAAPTEKLIAAQLLTTAVCHLRSLVVRLCKVVVKVERFRYVSGFIVEDMGADRQD
jgi:hypothetical protein